ncbi:MAG: ribose-phosphate pyrophosphokinase [Candidatus Aenigmarchaeota archaeon]|nr:ribose-phosphate pyrophosphokinase [Candidatus Aenigmarchaeota archaeon]
MSNQPYAIVIPRYDEKRGLSVPYLGDQVLAEISREHGDMFSPVYAIDELFSDGSNKVVLDSSVRKKEVYVINQPSLHPNETLMFSLLIIDALNRCDAKEIVVIEPYLSFLRQDKMHGREPVTSRLIGDLYLTVGAKRVMTFHPHVDQAVAAFSSRCHLEPFPLYRYLAECYRQRHELNDAVVCAPDLGAVEIAEKFAEVLGLPLVVTVKERIGTDRSRIKYLIGDVTRKKVIIFDDVLGTGGTIFNARDYLMERGATDVEACASHLGLYNKKDPKTGELINPTDMIVREGMHVIGTDTIPRVFTPEQTEYFDIYSTPPLIASIILHRTLGESLSHFFDN